MELLSKPVSEVGRSDLDSLILERVPEGEHVEFKEDLSIEGQSLDPWM